jgi:hypothetical protein
MTIKKSAIKNRHTIGIRNEYENILNEIIDKKVGITGISGAIEWSLKNSQLILNYGDILYSIVNNNNNLPKEVKEKILTILLDR